MFKNFKFTYKTIFCITLITIVPVLEPDSRAITMLFGSSLSRMVSTLFDTLIWTSLALALLVFICVHARGVGLGLEILLPLTLFICLWSSTWLSGYKETELLALTFWRLLVPFLVYSSCSKTTFAAFCQAWYVYLSLCMALNSLSMYCFFETDGMYLSVDIAGSGRGYYLYGLDNECFMYALAGSAVGCYYYRALRGNIPISYLLIYTFIFGAYFATEAGTARTIIVILTIYLFISELTLHPIISTWLTILICFIGYFVVMIVPQSAALSDVLSIIGKESTYTGRTEIWKAALQALSNHWLFGYGISPTSMHYALSLVTINQFIAWQIGHLHNIVLEYLFKGGIIGLLAFVGNLLLPIVRLKINDYYPNVTSSTALYYFIVMWFTCMFEYRLDTIVFWLIIIMIYGIKLLDENGRYTTSIVGDD